MSDSIFDLDEFKPYLEAWNARQAEFAARASYYDGSVYNGVRDALGWLGPRLYKNIKPLYLPLARAVDVDAGIIPSGWAWPEDAPEAWQTARQQVFAWSSWNTKGVLYIHYGAIYGCSVLKVSDLRNQKQVVVSAINPACVLLTASGAYDSTPGQAIYVDQRSDTQGDYEYAEVVTPELVRTFRDGVSYGFDGREAEYTNELNVVPFIEVRHIETGAALGECTYQKAIPMLDEVNELASYLSTIIKKHAEPQWAVIGAEATDLEHSGDNVWFMPGASDLKIAVPGIDIAGVLAFVNQIAANVKESLPELSFDELKKGQIATATVELQLAELTLKVKRTRPNYDDGLIQALRMAGQAGQTMGLDSIAALNDPQLSFDNERPVLPMDAKTQLEIQKLQNEIAQQGNYP